MKAVFVEFKTSILATDDDVENDIREAVARAGHQVGDCAIVSRSGTGGTAEVEVDAPIAGELGWYETRFFATTCRDTLNRV
jgi:hypothetical protein